MGKVRGNKPIFRSQVDWSAVISLAEFDYTTLINNKIREWGHSGPFPVFESWKHSGTKKMKRGLRDPGARYGVKIEIFGVVVSTGTIKCKTIGEGERLLAKKIWQRLMDIELAAYLWRGGFYEKISLANYVEEYAEDVDFVKLLVPYTAGLDTFPGLDRIQGLFEYFDFDTISKASNYGIKMAEELVEVLRVVPAPIAEKFLKALFRGCRKQLKQYDTAMNARARGPDIRAGELKEDDVNSVKIVCAALVQIPRQHVGEEMMWLLRIVNGTQDGQRVSEGKWRDKDREFADSLVSNLPMLQVVRENRDNYEKMKEFWSRSGYEIPDSQWLVEKYELDPDIGQWDRSAL